MKTKNVIMLPLLSATFLLSSCKTTPSESSSPKESTPSSEEKPTPIEPSSSKTPEIASDADKDLAVLKGAMENSINANGFKTEITPFETAISGLKYSQEGEEEVKNTNWDVLLNATSINSTTTHINEGKNKEDYNFSLQVKNLSIGQVKYGLGPLFSDGTSSATAMNSLIKAFGSGQYLNAYYSGANYSDRIFYDVKDEKGEDSNAAMFVSGLNPFILKLLDQAGYSVYVNDNPKNDSTYEIMPNGYISIPEGDTTIPSDSGNIEDNLPENWQETVMDFILSIKDEFKDNIISTKTGSEFTLSISFNDKEIKDAINNYIASLPADWKYTIPLPSDEDGSTNEIVVDKMTLQLLAATLETMGSVDRFNYEIKYDENVLLGGAFNFEMTMNKSMYDSAFSSMQPAEGETSKSLLAVTNVKISEEMKYTAYSLKDEDSDPSKLQENLRSFASIPDTDVLATYQEQKLPPKKENA